MACLQNVFFFPVQTKIVETDFLVPFPIPVLVTAAKRMSGELRVHYKSSKQLIPLFLAHILVWSLLSRYWLWSAHSILNVSLLLSFIQSSFDLKVCFWDTDA